MSFETPVLVENSKIGISGNMIKKGNAYRHFIRLPVLKKQTSHKIIIRGRVIAFSLVNIAAKAEAQENIYILAHLETGLPSSLRSLDLR